MAREPTQSDIDLAQALLTAKRAEDQIIATLVYRGLERAAAEGILDDCLGRKPMHPRPQRISPSHSHPAGTTASAAPGLATLSLVLGALSLLGLAFPILLLLGIPAVVCAHIVIYKIRKWDVQRSGLRATEVGLVCGYVAVGVLLFDSGTAYLRVTRVRRLAQMHQCQQNLQEIDKAKVLWGLERRKRETDTPPPEDLREYLKQGFPVCPGGGVYTINSLSHEPTCSIEGHGEYVRLPLPKSPLR